MAKPGSSGKEETDGAESPGSGSPWPRRLVAGSLLLLLLLGACWWETEHSTLQSRLAVRIVDEVSHDLGEGPSDRIVFPAEGPYDQRLGYTRIPSIAESLAESGFRVTHQARVTPRMVELAELGVYPLYEEKPTGGLTLLDRRGEVYWSTPHPERVYRDFDSIPPLLWRSLLFIENRALLDPDRPHRNPAVEWDRFARSVVELGMRALGSERNVPGGSTLATQLEKFRHSPGGLTATPADKLRQMATATGRAYLEGPNTLDAQRRVVRAYLNTVPLAAQRGHGEVVGTADGLWAWYGTPFDEANRLLRGTGVPPSDSLARARVFRQALSLLVAHRRPSYYLTREAGRRDLAALTDQHIRLLDEAGVVGPDLARRALAVSADVLARAPERPPVSFVERKAATQIRNHLLSQLGAPSLYELDRYDATVRTTLDMTWQDGVAELFQRLTDPAWVASSPFAADRLLDRGDPAHVLYSFTLLETTPLGNAVRVQMDSYDGPLSLTEAGRLELGSTAKLRTLVTYLAVVAELHADLSGLPADSLGRVPVAQRDRLSRWAVDWLGRNPGADLEAMLEAAMLRTYSASPSERFATGGGVQTFSNFDDTYDGRVMTVLEGFRQSVNLVSIRTMRDVVHYFMYRGEGSTADVLEDPELRQAYLRRFADDEGTRFLRQFWSKYRDRRGPEIFDALVEDRSLGPQRLAWAFRTIAPDAGVDRLASFLEQHTPHSDLTPEAVEDLFRRSDPSEQTLNDLGFLARIHPLELWLVRHLLDDPETTLEEVLEQSRDVRQEVYQWLFRTRRRNAQDQRIRTMLELEAFQEIHRRWRRLGYPFRNIVPSFGTAIGSSGDRPLALAELVGILRNDGVRRPVVRVEEVRLGEDTPFETRLARVPAEGERVLEPEVAAVARAALLDVVENGTARRARGSVLGPDGEPVEIGGKTGTGDNRFNVFGPGGRVLESRVVNRTATFAFFLGERHFGVVTAYVPGPRAGGYRFTSALPSQILRELGPLLSPLTAEAAPPPPPEADPGP